MSTTTIHTTTVDGVRRLVLGAHVLRPGAAPVLARLDAIVASGDDPVLRHPAFGGPASA